MALSTQKALDGDAGWSGFRSRQDPLTLPSGIAQRAENMRFIRGRATLRRGGKRLADNISASSAPVTIPFALGADISISSITRSSTTATATTGSAHGYSTGDQVNIRGADQTAYNIDAVITVTGATTFTYTVAGSPTTPATGGIIANKGPVVRNSYTGGIFASCVFSSPASTPTGNGNEYIVLAADDRAYLWRDGESIVTKTYPAGQTIDEADSVKLIQCFDGLFLFRSRPLTGDYARKSATLTRSGATVTATCTGHGFTTSDRVAIEGAAQSGYNHEFPVSGVIDANTFTFSVSHSPTSPGTGTITARRVKPPLYWDGTAGNNFVATSGGNNAAGDTFSNLRSTSIAAYFNNQLVIAPTPAQDTILVSDILDYGTFDPLLKSFRANAGSADRIVALHPFAEGDILVFMRNSIYRAHIEIASDGVSIDPATSFIQMITNEVGCRAANTIVTAGSFVYFLADQGVYRLDSQYTDLKVRGVQLPLSDPIADVLDEINEETVSTSCAAWFDNRYWLALPSEGSSLPDVVLSFNVLNQEWESIDSYPTEMHSLVVSDYNSKRRLFGGSRSGKLFVLEERTDGDDPNDSAAVGTVAIDGLLRTRRFWLNSPMPKRWVRVLINMSLESAASVNVTARTFDADQSVFLGATTNSADATEDYSEKLPVRVVAHSLEIDIENTTTSGFEVKTLFAEAAKPDSTDATRGVR